VCYREEFDRSRVVLAYVGDSPKIGSTGAQPLGDVGLSESIEARPAHVVKRSNVQRSAGKELEKIRPLASRLSKSLKVIGTDTDRSATYDFLLLLHMVIEYTLLIQYSIPYAV